MGHRVSGIAAYTKMLNDFRSKSLKLQAHFLPSKPIYFFTKPQITGRRKKCHTIDCARNTFLLLQKHMTSGTELILIGWKNVPNEELVQCDHRFASQPLHSSQLFDTSLQKARGTTSLCGPRAACS